MSMIRGFLLTLLMTACVSASRAVDHNEWVLTERLRDRLGQSHVNYSTSFDTLDRYFAVGSVTENLFKGQTKIYHDTGRGLLLEATLRDPEGVIHDNYGGFVRLFKQFGAYHIAVSATGKNADGAVFVYKEASGLWSLQQVLTPPENTGEYMTNFGRSTHFDGDQLLVSAVSRYISSKRFVVGALNVKGTRYFYEADGVGPLPTDPILVFASKEGRRNSTRLTLAQTIRDGPYTDNFGESISVSGQLMAVGSAFRKEILFGHGTDGDLLVKSGEVKLLDGAAEYNFDNVYIQSGGTLTVERFQSLRGFGGVLNLKVLNRFTVEAGGTVNLTSVGYEGAETHFQTDGLPKVGKGPGAGKPAWTDKIGVSSCDFDGTSTLAALVDDGFSTKRTNSSLAFAEPSGGGGSHGTRGEPGTPVQCGLSGDSGAAYGTVLVQDPQRGSGGGAGHGWKIGAGGGGGTGGGIIKISARVLTNYGTIETNGGPGETGGYYSGGGGGGAGGSIVLQGTELANYGYIFAKGGAGGQRAIDTGFGGDLFAKGGDGGHGRIRFDFLTTRSIGYVVPAPKNVTTFQGDVFLYRKSLVDKSWNLITKIPKLDGMMFIGHSVALDGTKLAVASDEGTEVQPIQAVFLMGIGNVQNESSPIWHNKVYHPPDASTDRKYGFHMAMNNLTLVIGAAGSELFPGVVYVHQGRDLYGDTTEMTTLRTEKPEPNDAFGHWINFKYPNLFIQLPTSHDDNVPQNDRLSGGCVHLWKHIRNISVANSYVSCEYSVITANTTLNCTVHTRDRFGLAVGDLLDLPHFQAPNHLDFKLIGDYSFQVRPEGLGQHEIIATYKHQRLVSFAVTVTRPIVPEHTNFTCSPAQAEAGQTVTCTIGTSAEAGEENAAAYFDVAVYNFDDTTLVSEDVFSDKGYLRTPKSNFIVQDPAKTDFVVFRPAVTFVRHGVFQFSYVTNRPGTWAAFVEYQRNALQYPNPIIIDALDGPVSVIQSRLSCPQIAAPHRTMVCTVQLNSPSNIPTNARHIVGNFSSARYVTASLARQFGSTYNTSVSAVAVNEGRVALLIQPPDEGTLSITAKYGNVAISGSPATIDVRNIYQQNCVPNSRVFSSWHLMSQHTQGQADASIFGNVATRAALLDGKGLCDDPRV